MTEQAQHAPTLSNLEKCFMDAQAAGAKFVGVAVKTPETPDLEFIINPQKNWGPKLAFYQNRYNSNLTMRGNPSIQIVGFSYGNSADDIINVLY